jgi:hypothetical protein
MTQINAWRGYFLTNNIYMSSLQAGLQTAHAVAELYEKYQFRSSPEPTFLHEWAQFHKTIIILNGGNHGDLLDLYGVLEPLAEKLNLPVAKFHEDERSLNGACTCVGIILPDSIYDLEIAVDPRTQDIWNMTFTTEQQIKMILSKYRLAH